MYAVLQWQLATPAQLNIGIYNEAGTLIQPVITAREYAKGGYKMTVEFEAADVSAGNYYIRLKEQIVHVD